MNILLTGLMEQQLSICSRPSPEGREEHCLSRESELLSHLKIQKVLKT